MSPEQIRGTPAVSHKTDLYAFGVVLYQMLVGKPPFEGSTPVVLMHSHLNEPAPRPSAKVHEIPKALDELIVTLMAKAPGTGHGMRRRWASSSTELRDKAASGASVPWCGRQTSRAWSAKGRRRPPPRTAPAPPFPLARKLAKPVHSCP